MARKIPGLTRVLGEGSLAGVAYGEVGSSIYFALGIVAFYALGLTPWVLLGVGLLFLLVSLSYAEGVAAIPRPAAPPRGAARFSDPVGFVTGWVLFLDYAIVIALAALFVPHYLGQAVGWEGITQRPWDLVVGFADRRHRAGAARPAPRPLQARHLIAVAALVSHLVIVVVGFATLVSLNGVGRGVDLGEAPTWHSLAFALPIATLAYTGLETVANLAADTSEPGRALPRGLFRGLRAAVVVSVLIGVVGLSAYPAVPTPGGGAETALGTEWSRAPLVGITGAFDGHLPAPSSTS